ncbi:MAG: DUF3298 and DUF4163 domain-containing protein, partial [Bacteroidota bacterium]|nr:DUF3298 and DUF4163 domain-containing protein [Bacteroidota bacterium]MDX5431476.1 DUF3298 and DUF4163 domain-containing protein [Bacteroidota bacterium]MDX5470200.1 DUF3298 and DUF4163 domain-containing protein [Bacteroidota bacterium]
MNGRILRLLQLNSGDTIQSAEAYADYLIEEFKKQPNAESQNGWQIENEITLEYSGNQLISIRQSSFENLGGAHPNIRINLRSYSTLSGERVSLKDVFLDNYEDSLLQLCNFHLRNALSSSLEIDYADMNDAFKAQSFKLSESFALNETGIVFIHLDPIIQNNGTGFIEFTIPYSELIDANLIDEKGVLGFLLGSV